MVLLRYPQASDPFIRGEVALFKFWGEGWGVGLDVEVVGCGHGRDIVSVANSGHVSCQDCR